MNSKPIFHIFGVPDGFDILNGTPDITPSFQRYYNGSEENTKFSIHRESNGDITYAYLKYNLSSYQSRTGSFFGMSLTFSKEYCTDPMKLYKLFDFVYANKVLGCSADKGLLQKIEVESKIQARYLIPNFGSAKDYIQQEIEFVLLNNITKLFANSFQPIGVLFKNDQSHLTAQIPLADANNEKIISLLHTYNRIAISPDWKPKPPIIGGGSTTSPEPEIVIDPETIKLYDEDVKNYQSYLIESLANVKASNINDARRGKAEIESVLKNLQSGTSTDQRLPQLISDYKALSGQFAELIQKIAGEQNKGPTPPPPPPGSSTKHPIPWWKQYLPYISGVAVLVIFVVLLSNVFKKEDPPESTRVDTTILPHDPNYMALARKALNKEDFEGALKELKNEDNYWQYGLYDSIYDQWIASLLHDNEWNDAWQKADGIDNSRLKGKKQSKIQNKCQNYFAYQVQQADKSNANTIKKQIEGLNFDYNKREEHINKLEGILNSSKATDPGGTGSTSSPDNQGKKKFAIKMQLAPDVSEKLGDITKAKRIDNDTVITTDKYTAFVFCLINADSDNAITDKKYFQSSTVKFDAMRQASGWYKIDKTTAKNKQLIFESTDKSEKITITFK